MFLMLFSCTNVIVLPLFQASTLRKGFRFFNFSSDLFSSSVTLWKIQDTLWIVQTVNSEINMQINKHFNIYYVWRWFTLVSQKLTLGCGIISITSNNLVLNKGLTWYLVKYTTLSVKSLLWCVKKMWKKKKSS